MPLPPAAPSMLSLPHTPNVPCMLGLWCMLCYALCAALRCAVHAALRQRLAALNLWCVEVPALLGLEGPEQPPLLLPSLHPLQLAAPVGHHLREKGAG